MESRRMDESWIWKEDSIGMKYRDPENSGTVLSGRIGRFARILSESVGDVVCGQILREADTYESLNAAGRAAWWRGAMARLDEAVGPEKAGRIMEACGRRCCGQTPREHARRLWEASVSFEEFLAELNHMGIGGGRLRSVQDDEDRVVTAGYDRCYCGQVRDTLEPFQTMTYCQCSAGWFKQLFESAMDCPVIVSVDRSIITGSPTCEFTIVLSD